MNSKLTKGAIINKGATLYKEGCTFALWAPNAEKVFIVGTFNKWHKTKHPMTKNSEGVWFLDIPGAKLNDEYRYRIITEGKEYMRIDPYARQVTGSTGNAIINTPLTRDKKSRRFVPPKLNEMAIYELHIGTFGKVEGQSGPGTLEGAIARLPYLQKLGINAVEVMPLAEFAGGYSWGYNPSNIFAIENEYGSPGSFANFVDECHKLGIAVIVDVVYNHLGPSDLDLWQFDGWNENDKGGIYFYNDWKANTPWGETRPDYGRKEVREYIRDNALMWIREFDVDGLRWDMTSFIRNVEGRDNNPAGDLSEGWSLMQWVNQEIYKVKAGVFSIAEDLQGNPALTKAETDGGAGFSAQWAAPFVHPIRAVLTTFEDQDRDMNAVRNAVLHRYFLDAYERVVYTESHDEVANGKARLPEEVDPGNASSWTAKKKSSLGAVMVFTVQGIPMIFQGQEFLEDDWFHDKDPVDWSKKKKFAGILALYKDLIALRLNKNGATQGLTGQEVDVFHLNNNDKIIAYHRWSNGGPGDSVVVIVNFSSHPVADYILGLPASGEWIVRFNSDSNYYDEEFENLGSHLLYAEPTSKDNLPAQGKVAVGAYSALILSQEK